VYEWNNGQVEGHVNRLNMRESPDLFEGSYLWPGNVSVTSTVVARGTSSVYLISEHLSGEVSSPMRCVQSVIVLQSFVTVLRMCFGTLAVALPSSWVTTVPTVPQQHIPPSD
jgi:hypothetical protein